LIIKQYIEEAGALAQELLNHIGLSVPRLADTLLLPQPSV